MALSDIVNISISLSADKVTRDGFGVPIILAPDCSAGFTERIRYYTDMTGVLVDFAVTTATYKQALQVFSQNPRPPRLAVGRCALPPTQRWAITPVAGDLVNYQMRVNGNLISVTSDGSGTVTEIIALLKNAIDALSLGITVTDQTTFMRIVANTAGAFFSVEVLDTLKLKIFQDHADPGLATDLAAIAAVDSTWYGMLYGFGSAACLAAIATFAEANDKLAILETQDSDVINLSNGSDTGGSITIAGTLKAATRLRTALIYNADNSEFSGAAWAGACLPLDPGSETWAFKTLGGVAATSLSATQRTNLVAKYVNFYESISGVSVTNQGKVSGNEYIDVIRFRDWLRSNMAADIYAALTRMKKIPYTDGGISVIEGIVLARLKAGVDVGGLASSPAPTVTVPKVSAVSSADKSSRTLNNVKFDATLAGAIQAINVTGVITV